MPNWVKVLNALANSIAEDWEETKSRKASRRRGGQGKSIATQSTCTFWDCNRKVKSGYTYCYSHYQEHIGGLINKCPGCSRAKHSRYPTCLDCRGKSNSDTVKTKYTPEYSPAWESGDAEATVFYVYILKLSEGKFYAGQTRELRERLSEHRDGRVRSTSGLDPKLVWFTEVSARSEATELEVELKKLVDRNPRAIRRLVIDFQTLVGELDFSKRVCEKVNQVGLNLRSMR